MSRLDCRTRSSASSNAASRLASSAAAAAAAASALEAPPAKPNKPAMEFITAGWFPPSLRRKCVSETGGSRAPVSAASPDETPSPDETTKGSGCTGWSPNPWNSGSRSRSSWKSVTSGASNSASRSGVPGGTNSDALSNSRLRASSTLWRATSAAAVAAAAATAAAAAAAACGGLMGAAGSATAEGRDGLVALGAGASSSAPMRTGLRGVGVGSAASFALDWACAWGEAGRAGVRTRTVASASAGVCSARLEDADRNAGRGRTVWYPSPRPRLSRGSSLSLGVRGGSPCSSSNESSIVAAAGAPDVWDEAPARRHF